MNPLELDIDRLRASLAAHPGFAGTHSLAVAAGVPGEGCSTIAHELARGFARDRGARVLLLDAAFRAPRPHLQAGVAPGPGLVDLLGGDDPPPAPAPVGADGVALIPAGSLDGQGLPAGWPAALRDLLTGFAQRYDRIVLDAGALLAYPEAVPVVAAADAAVLVVRSGGLPGAAVVEARRRIGPIQPNLLGVILNRPRTPPGWWARRF
jgi:Mrp family chromosome partitioning ATPase